MTDQQPTQRTVDELAAVLDERLGIDQWSLCRGHKKWNGVWFVHLSIGPFPNHKQQAIHEALQAAVEWLEREGK